MRATDLVGGPFTPVGFYYKTFIRPRRLWPLYEKVLRHAAGLGRAAQAPGRARVAHRVPPPPRRRARGRRRRGRPVARRSPPPSWAPTSCSPTRASSRAGGCSPRAATSAPPSSPRAPARPASRCSGARRRSAASTAWSPVWQGDTLHQVRARRHRRSRPARSSSRSSSPTTTCRASCSPAARGGWSRATACAPGTRAVVATSRPRARGGARAARRGRRDRGRGRPAPGGRGPSRPSCAPRRRGPAGATVLEAKGRGAR